MNKTKIEWCDYTINPVKGLCPMACEYCYARKMYKRFKWNPIIRYDDWVWHDGCRIPKGSKIFVGSTMELFGEWVKPEWLKIIFSYCRSCPSHVFIFLTKQPQNLVNWSPFPKNCWVGITICDDKMAGGIVSLEDVDATIKFVSYEPMLEYTELSYYTDFFDWCILGSKTLPPKHPPHEWVNNTIRAMDDANLPVFVKEPLANHYNIRRQEFPNVNLSGEQGE